MQLAGNHGNFPTKSQNRRNGPAQRGSRPVSTSTVTQQQKSSSKPQQRSNSPLRSQQRCSSPANLLERSPSPVSSQQRSFYPVRSQERSSSPVRSHQNNPSPLRFQQNDSSIMRSPQKNSSVKRQQGIASPMRSQQRSVSPIRTQLRSTSTLKPQQISSSPVRTQSRTTSPVRTQPRSTSPVRSQARSSSPFRDQQKSTSPLSFQRSTSPARSYQRSAADVGQSGNYNRRPSVPKTANADSFHKNCAQRGHMDVSRYGTERVASQSMFSNHSPSHARKDHSNLGVSRRLTSSTSSLDSECNPRGTSSRINYTMLADIPRAKCLRPDLNLNLNMKAQKRSPGKAEVERIFGEERRTADVLEAFQALEAGLIEGLSGKNTIMEWRRARRQSTPCLYPEESVRMRQELKLRRASLHPPPRTDMEFSNSKVTSTRSRDISPQRTRTQGRAAFPEPEWINRDKILRPVGAQDKVLSVCGHALILANPFKMCIFNPGP
ncbi:uncharacterized protein LOC142099468 isoform X1 [Mixophyes fleayi]